MPDDQFQRRFQELLRGGALISEARDQALQDHPQSLCLATGDADWNPCYVNGTYWPHHAQCRYCGGRVHRAHGHHCKRKASQLPASAA